MDKVYMYTYDNKQYYRMPGIRSTTTKYVRCWVKSLELCNCGCNSAITSGIAVLPDGKLYEHWRTLYKLDNMNIKSWEI